MMVHSWCVSLSSFHMPNTNSQFSIIFKLQTSQLVLSAPFRGAEAETETLGGMLRLCVTPHFPCLSYLQGVMSPDCNQSVQTVVSLPLEKLLGLKINIVLIKLSWESFSPDLPVVALKFLAHCFGWQGKIYARVASSYHDSAKGNASS